MTINEQSKIHTLRSLTDGGCGREGVGLEKISKTNSLGGVEKSGKFNSRGGWNCFFLLSFLSMKTTYCRIFYIQQDKSN